MCMFCAAMPAVATATAAMAQRERRKMLEENSRREPAPAPRVTWRLSPQHVGQFGALAFVGLLIASAFYHTHLPN